MNKAWRRPSSADWASRAILDLCDENQAWTTGWRRLRARSDDDFHEAVAKANEMPRNRCMLYFSAVSAFFRTISKVKTYFLNVFVLFFSVFRFFGI